jgi:C2H2-type zinc finger/Zinc finger, C2H2 type
VLANAFKCKYKCRGYFLTEADREEHIASAHTKYLLRAEVTCLYCNKIFIDKDVLNNHIYSVHSAVKVICKFFNCHQYFHSQTEADKHFEQQHQNIEDDKKHCCLKCNYKSANKYSLKHHISGMHGEQTLPCPKCSRFFSSSNTLKVHVSKVHSPPKVCPHCNKSYVIIRMHLKQDKCKRCEKVLLCVRVAQLHKKWCKV